jgi:small subunit ribosomal protein S1
VEVDKQQNMDELATLYDQSICDVKEGAILEGMVVQISDRDVLVDIGYKSEGLVHKSEISEPDKLKIGDKIDVLLESKENDTGMVVVSHEKAKKHKGWQSILDNNSEGDIIEGRISRKVRGGFMVDVGLEAFLPASLSSMQDLGGADNLVGQKMPFKIVKINIPRKNIVLSRKELVDEEKKKEKQAILETLNKGDIVKGIVRNITDFGAFVDIGGGITGLLHITDMSWGRISKPSEILKVNDEIEVKILDFDKEKMKVSLGIKQKTENPWENIEDKCGEGSVVKGKVVNIMPYGVFIELQEGIEGLVHISEFSWIRKFNHPGERFSIGEEVEAVVLKLDRDSKKLSLGLKQLEEDPWQGVEDRFHVGDKIKGQVNTLTDYGAFIELEKGVEGLVHVSDLSWTKRLNHPKELLQKGDEVEAMVLNVDEKNRRIALGVKQMVQDPWEDITKKYESGTICKGVVTNITNFGMFVELEKDLEGLLHISELSIDPATRMEDLYKVGDEFEVKVIHIDGVQKKIALTVKGLVGSDGNVQGEVSETPVEAVEAAAEPVEAAAEPVEAAVEPVEAAVEPVEAAAEPVEAAVEPVEAAVEPVEAAAEPVEEVVTPAETPEEPVSEAATSAEPVEGSAEEEKKENLSE